MVDLKYIGGIFGWVASGISLYFFLSPGVPFYKLIKGHIKLADAPGVLLIFSFLNCLLWLNYGLLVDKAQMYGTNGSGGAITLIYITIFLIFLTKQIYYYTILLILLLIAIIGVITYFSYFVIDYKIVGISANVFNVCMYAATGEKIYRVFKTKNYNLMPIFSIVGAFLSSGCWVIYGTFDFDYNVIIPNALGVIFSMIQLVVYFHFYCQKKNDEDLLNTSNEDDKLI